MKILVIDNYDSFTFNLVQIIGKLAGEMVVVRNDQLDVESLAALQPDKIVISPGPGRPEVAGISPEVIRRLGLTIPVLGVCLGHQAIGWVFGCRIIHAPVLMHGKTSEIIHDGQSFYRRIPQRFKAGRYHSLVIDRDSIQDDLEISAETSDGIVMGVRHKSYPIEGIQFHPESVLTEVGESILKNWVEA